MIIALCIATYTDIKKREIPLWVFPTISVIFILIRFNDINWLNSITGLIIGIISFSFLAWKFNGGGADIIMMASIGFILGPIILMHIVIFASLSCLLYYAYKKVTTVPYAPFVMTSYIICFLGGYLYGINDYRFLGFRYFLL